MVSAGLFNLGKIVTGLRVGTWRAPPPYTAAFREEQLVPGSSAKFASRGTDKRDAVLETVAEEGEGLGAAVLPLTVIQLLQLFSRLEEKYLL